MAGKGGGEAKENPRSDEKFRFAIDRGGTFTDVYAECPGGKVIVMKLLSVDPAYPDAPREGIRRILEQVIYRMISSSPDNPKTDVKMKYLFEENSKKNMISL